MQINTNNIRHKWNIQLLKLIFILLFLSNSIYSYSDNPIVHNMGMADLHIFIFNNKAYLYATRDADNKAKDFVMPDWKIWSSDDLVDWKLESVLKPADTYIGKPFPSCWATDIATRNGKYYWYFSEGNEQTGVVVGDSPAGPWKDPLGKPLLTSEMTPTHEYDMGIIQDVAGDYYIVFGVWDYYIAKLNKDMISLVRSWMQPVLRPVTKNRPGHTDFSRDAMVHSSSSTTSGIFRIATSVKPATAFSAILLLVMFITGIMAKWR